MYFPKFWFIYLKAGNKLGDGRDMMQKQGMTKMVQKCSVYIDLMDFKGILQRDCNKGYTTDFFGFPKFGMESPSFLWLLENLGVLYFQGLRAFLDYQGSVFSQVCPMFFLSWEEIWDMSYKKTCIMKEALKWKTKIVA